MISIGRFVAFATKCSHTTRMVCAFSDSNVFAGIMNEGLIQLLRKNTVGTLEKRCSCKKKGAIVLGYAKLGRYTGNTLINREDAMDRKGRCMCGYALFAIDLIFQIPGIAINSNLCREVKTARELFSAGRPAEEYFAEEMINGMIAKYVGAPAQPPPPPAHVPAAPAPVQMPPLPAPVAVEVQAPAPLPPLAGPSNPSSPLAPSLENIPVSSQVPVSAIATTNGKSSRRRELPPSLQIPGSFAALPTALDAGSNRSNSNPVANLLIKKIRRRRLREYGSVDPAFEQ